jgi:hypothetical protein
MGACVLLGAMQACARANAPPPARAQHPMASAATAVDASVARQVPDASAPVADATDAARARVTLLFADGGAVALDEARTTHAWTAAIESSEGGSARSFVSARGARHPEHYVDSDAAVEVRVPTSAHPFTVRIDGAVPQLWIGAASRAQPALLLQLDDPNRPSFVIGGRGAINEVFYENLRPSTLRFTVVSAREGRAPVTLRVSIERPPRFEPVGEALGEEPYTFGRFVRSENRISDDRAPTYEWSIETSTSPGPIRIPGFGAQGGSLYSARAQQARDARHGSIELTMTTLRNRSSIRARPAGRAVVIETRVGAGPWRQVRALSMPANVLFEPHPDGVFEELTED